MNRHLFIYRLLPTAVFILFGLISCKKVIDISIPDKERKIVVNGLISPDQTVKISLSRSLSVLEKDSLIPINGGDVSLYNGTELIGKFREDSSGFYSLPDFRPQVGQSYRLSASGNGLNKVEATATLPTLVPIISVDTATIISEYYRELRLSVKFKDPPGVHNVYSFGVDVTSNEFDYNNGTYTGKKITRKSYLYSANDDQFLKDESTNFEGKLFFEDILFDGLTKTVEFGVSDYSYYESDTMWLTVNMEQIDRPYYLYVLSYRAYQEAHGNPFSEPVQVYSNVDGGFGIFSGSTSFSFSIVTLGYGKSR